jgi:hypothetical protein
MPFKPKEDRRIRRRNAFVVKDEPYLEDWSSNSTQPQISNR